MWTEKSFSSWKITTLWGKECLFHFRVLHIQQTTWTVFLEAKWETMQVYQSFSVKLYTKVLNLSQSNYHLEEWGCKFHKEPLVLVTTVCPPWGCDQDLAGTQLSLTKYVLSELTSECIYLFSFNMGYFSFIFNYSQKVASSHFFFLLWFT